MIIGKKKHCQHSDNVTRKKRNSDNHIHLCVIGIGKTALHMNEVFECVTLYWISLQLVP